MICNGAARSNGSQLVQYLLNSGKNESADVLLLSRESSLADEIAHMTADAAGSRCRKEFYHAQIRPAEGETWTRTQMHRAADIYAEEMGFQGLARAEVLHRFKGEDHLHIVWGRVDPETGSARDYKNDYAKQERAGRRMEAEFGLKRTRGRFYDENGKAYTADNPRKRSSERTNKAEQDQHKRTGENPNERKAQITDLWNRASNGREFRAMVEAAGYKLAQGGKSAGAGGKERPRVYVVVDGYGEVHGLRQQLKTHGIRAIDVTTKMADVPLSSLPAVAEVRRQQRVEQGQERKQRVQQERRERPAEPMREERKPEPPRHRVPRQRQEPRYTPAVSSRATRPELRVAEDESTPLVEHRAGIRQRAPDTVVHGIQSLRELLPRPTEIGVETSARTRTVRSDAQVEAGMFAGWEIDAQRAKLDESKRGTREWHMRRERLDYMLSRGPDESRNQNKP